MSDFAIKLDNISKIFHTTKGKSIFEKIKTKYSFNEKILALDHISCEIPKGEIVGVLGLNGSGKTTLLRTIAGIYKPDSGTVKINGKLAPLLHIGTGFKDEFAAEENIIMSGLLLGLSKNEIKQKMNEIIEFAELEKFSQMKLQHYSTGMRVRLAFAISLQIDPDILILDEALAVGDKIFRQKSFEAFKQFKAKMKTVLFSTHSLGPVKNFADSAILIHKGKLIMKADPTSVIEKYDEITTQ